ncbi:MAG TPA: hypothetical protein VD905_07645 [Flavobacteriales bacterium]|nr:hypothetical protein [Flavobacteriales bacterium]
MKKAVFLLMWLLAGKCGVMFGQPVVLNSNDKPLWHKIGEISLDFHENRDAIVVQSDEKFGSVKFIVTEAPVEMLDLEIFCEIEGLQTVRINANVQVPGESKPIDLNNGEWKLKRIVFVSNTEPSNRDKKGHVEIWGIKPKDVK